MRRVALLVSGLLLASCTSSGQPEPAFSGQNFWFPGYIGVPGFGPSGLGPAGYPGVLDDTIDSEPVQQFLASVLLQSDDLPTGMTLQLSPKGNLISQPTFTLCNSEFESEATRLVRRSVQAVDVDADPVGIRAEAVQHESAEAAAAALDELKSVAETCADSSFEFFDVAIDSSGLVSSEFLVSLSWVNSINDSNVSTLQIWQQRGNTLVGVEISEPTAQPLELGVVEFGVEIAELVAQRLAAADPLDIGELE